MLKYHILMFRICGLWSYKNSSWLYDCWTMIFSVVVAICFPLTQLACVLFVETVDEIVEHLILSSTVAMVSVKAFNVLIQKRKLVQLFDDLKSMDENVAIESGKYREIFENVSKKCNFLSQSFFGAYIMSWSILFLQIFISKVEDRGWWSTHLFPSPFLQQPLVYWSGMVYQAASNLIICTFAAAADTYVVVLINILVGHIDALKVQLTEFAVSGDIENGTKDYQALVRFCEKYKTILRCDGVINGLQQK